MLYSCEQLAEGIGCTKQTVRNWVSNGWLSPAVIDERGIARFSEEQYNGIVNALPLPKYSEREEWLTQFSRETVDKSEGYVPATVDNAILPSNSSKQGSLFKGNGDEESKRKVSAILKVSNEMFAKNIKRDKINIYDQQELEKGILEYLVFCQERGVLPSFKRLANWLGYTSKGLNNIIKRESETGFFLEYTRDVIKDNYEQAGLNNAANPIMIMFLLKACEGYVEASKVIVEPSESILGKPKDVEEIVASIDADVIEE